MGTIATIYTSDEAWSDWPMSLYRIRAFSSMYGDYGLDIQQLRLRLVETASRPDGRPDDEGRDQIFRQVEAYYTSHLDENGHFDIDTAPRPEYVFVVPDWEEEYYSPSCLSAEAWGFWDDEDSWDSDACDAHGRRPWTKEEWQEELHRQAWELLDAHVGPPEGEDGLDAMTRMYNKMFICVFWAQVMHALTRDPREEG